MAKFFRKIFSLFSLTILLLNLFIFNANALNKDDNNRILKSNVKYNHTYYLDKGEDRIDILNQAFDISNQVMVAYDIQVGGIDFENYISVSKSLDESIIDYLNQKYQANLKYIIESSKQNRLNEERLEYSNVFVSDLIQEAKSKSIRDVLKSENAIKVLISLQKNGFKLESISKIEFTTENEQKLFNNVQTRVNKRKSQEGLVLKNLISKYKLSETVRGTNPSYSSTYTDYVINENVNLNEVINILNLYESEEYIDKFTTIKFDTNNNYNSINEASEHNKKYKQTFVDGEKTVESNINPFNIFSSINTEAKGLNNAAATQLMYSWSNINLTADLIAGNAHNGNEFVLWNRHGAWNQRFTFNNSNEIRIAGKCLDISGGNYQNGTSIILWNCNGGSNQQWFFDGLLLRSKTNLSFCFDASNGLVNGSKIHLWTCHGGSNQKFVSGGNDFVTPRSITIHATPTGNISAGDYGHAFVSFENDYNGLVNTVSSWGLHQNDDTNSSNYNRYNNIADYDNVHIDKTYDWDNVNNSSFKRKKIYIDKKVSDLYRHNSAYRWKFELVHLDYDIYPFGHHKVNCAKQSSRVWRWVMEDMGYSYHGVPYTYFPSDIYNGI